MKVFVSKNGRSGLYIVTHEGKKGIQSQSENPPADGENVVWKCENPHLKKNSDSAPGYDTSLKPAQSEKDEAPLESSKETGDWFSGLFGG